jgi:hypothetical protein
VGLSNHFSDDFDLTNAPQGEANSVRRAGCDAARMARASGTNDVRAEGIRES